MRLDAKTVFEGFRLFTMASIGLAMGQTAAVSEGRYDGDARQLASALTAKIESSMRSPDFAGRLAVVEEALEASRARPEAFDPSPDNRLLERVFRLLMEPVLNENVYVDDLLWELMGGRHGGGRQPSADPALRERRQKLFAAWCDEAMERGSWINASLRHLAAASVAKGRPSADDLVVFVREVRADPVGGHRFEQPSWLEGAAQGYPSNYRLGMAELGFRLSKETMVDSREDPAVNSQGLLRLVGGKVDAIGGIPVHAIWSYPRAIRDGEKRHTPEQMEFIAKRERLFSDVCNWMMSSRRMKNVALPYWICRELHDRDAGRDVLEQAGTLMAVPASGGESGMSVLLRLADEALGIEHSVRVGEFVDAALRESIITADGDRDGEWMARLIRILRTGSSASASYGLPGVERKPGVPQPSRSQVFGSTFAVTQDVTDRRTAVHDRLMDFAMRMRPPPLALLFEGLDAVAETRIDLDQVIRRLQDAATSAPEKVASPLVQRTLSSRSLELRRRMARFFLDQAKTGGQSRDRQAVSGQDLINLIGGKVQHGDKRFIFAIWGFPFAITEGDNRDTEEEIAWIEERGKLFADLCDWMRTDEKMWEQLFPFWLCWKLHGPPEDGEIAGTLRQMVLRRGFSSVMSDIVRVADEGFGIAHQVRLAELVCATMRESPSRPESQGDANWLAGLIRLVADGSVTSAVYGFPKLVSSRGVVASRPASYPPSMAVTDELTKRRRAVHDQLVDLAMKSESPPVEILFRELGAALGEGRGTADAVSRLQTAARRDPGGMIDPMFKWLGADDRSGDRDISLNRAAALLDIESALPESAHQERFRVWRAARESVIDPSGRIFGQNTAPAPNEDSGGFMKRAIPLVDRLMKRLLAIVPPGECRFSVYAQLAFWSGNPDLAPLIEMARTEIRTMPDRFAQDFCVWLRKTAALGNKSAPPQVALVVEEVIAASTANRLGDGPELARLAFEIFDASGGANRNSIREGASARSSDAQETELADRRAAWTRVLDKAITHPDLAPHFLGHYLRLHLGETSELAFAAARRIAAQNHSAFRRAMLEVLTERQTPLTESQLVAFAELGFRLIGEFKVPGEMSGSSPWIATMLWKLDAAPSPKCAELRRRIVDLLVERGTVSADGFAAYARQRFDGHAEVDEVVEMARKITAQDPGAMSAALSHWVSMELSGSSRTSGMWDEREGLWYLQVLHGVAMTWPKDATDAQASWMTGALGFGVRLAPPQGQVGSFESGSAAETWVQRLAEVALERDDIRLNAFQIWASWKLRCQGGVEGVRRYLSARMTERSAEAGQMLSLWLSAPSGMDAETAVAVGQLCVTLIEQWPKESDQESLGWARSALGALSRGPAAGRYPPGYPIGSFAGKTVAPAPPSDLRLAESFARILAELKARRGADNFVVGVEARLLAAKHQNDDAALAVALQPLLAGQVRSSLLGYLGEVLGDAQNARNLRELAPRGYMMGFRSAGGSLDFSRSEEIVCAARILASLAGSGAMKADESAPLIKWSVSLLESIAQSSGRMPGAFPVPASVADQARFLLAKLSAETAKTPAVAISAIGSKMTDAATAPAAPAQAALEIIELAKLNPNEANIRLLTWSGEFMRTLGGNSAVDAAELVAEVGLAWRKASLERSPDWLVNFFSNFKSVARRPAAFPIPTESMSGQAMQRHETLCRRLYDVLLEFPECSIRGSYFGEMFEFAIEHGVGDEELAGLAMKHLKAAALKPASGPGSSPEIRIATFAGVPLDRIGSGRSRSRDPRRLLTPSAPVFLLEHGWRTKRREWLEQECAVLVERSLGVEAADAFRRKADVYFAPRDRFLNAASRWLETTARPRSSLREDASEVLRVAKLREIDLTVGDWIAMADLAEGVSDEMSYRYGFKAAVSAWMAYVAQRSASSMEADLLAMIEKLLGPKEEWESRIHAFAQRRSSGAEIRGRLLMDHLFDDPKLVTLGELLRELMESPESFWAGFGAARQTGLLQAAGYANLMPLARGGMATSAGDVKRWMQSSPLWKNEPEPDLSWLMPFTPTAHPVWSFEAMAASGVHSDIQAMIHERQKRAPSVAVALLDLASRCGEAAAVRSEDVEDALAPCAQILRSLNDGKRTEISSVLAGMIPDWAEIRSGAPAGSLVAALPEPRPPIGFEGQIVGVFEGPIRIPQGSDVDKGISNLAEAIQRQAIYGQRQAIGLEAAGLRALHQFALSRKDQSRDVSEGSLRVRLWSEILRGSSGLSDGWPATISPQPASRPVQSRFSSCTARARIEMFCVAPGRDTSGLFAGPVGALSVEWLTPLPGFHLDDPRACSRPVSTFCAHVGCAASPLILPGLTSMLRECNDFSRRLVVDDLLKVAETLPDGDILAMVVRLAEHRSGPRSVAGEVNLPPSLAASIREFASDRRRMLAARLAILSASSEVCSAEAVAGLCAAMASRWGAVKEAGYWDGAWSFMLNRFAEATDAPGWAATAESCCRFAREVVLEADGRAWRSDGSFANGFLSVALAAGDRSLALSLMDLAPRSSITWQPDWLLQLIQSDIDGAQTEYLPRILRAKSGGGLCVPRVASGSAFDSGCEETWLSLKARLRDSDAPLAADAFFAFCPDSSERPPMVAQIDRLRVLAEAAARRDDSVSGIGDALMRTRWGNDSSRLLPLLRRHPVVQSWQQSPSQRQTLLSASSTAESLSSAHVVFRWALAEALAGGDTKAWQGFVGELAQLQAQSVGAFQVRSNVWSTIMSLWPVLCGEWMRSNPPDRWPRMIPVASELLRHAGHRHCAGLHETIAVLAGLPAIGWDDASLMALIEEWKATMNDSPVGGRSPSPIWMQAWTRLSGQGSGALGVEQRMAVLKRSIPFLNDPRLAVEMSGVPSRSVVPGILDSGILSAAELADKAEELALLGGGKLTSDLAAWFAATQDNRRALALIKQRLGNDGETWRMADALCIAAIAIESGDPALAREVLRKVDNQGQPASSSFSQIETCFRRLSRRLGAESK